MSLATWKKEFFGNLKRAQRDNLAALRHGIRKWNGLREENLEKHEVSWDWDNNLQDDSGDLLEIDANTCALCCLYVEKKPRCAGCPLFEIRGCSCDSVMESEAESPYVAWTRDTNPLPMLDWLKAAERYEKAKGAGR